MKFSLPQILPFFGHKIKTAAASLKNKEISEPITFSPYDFAPFLMDYSFLPQEINQQQYHLAYAGWILKCMRFGEIAIEPPASYEKKIDKALSDGRIISRFYDDFGRFKRIVYPDKTEVIREYDERGNLSVISYSKGSIKYCYDIMDQLKGIEYSNGKAISFGYDSVGNPERISYSNGEAAFYNWNANNQLMGVADAFGAIEYQRDKLGNLSCVTYPDKIKYSFNLEGGTNTFSLKYNYSSENKISAIISPFGISRFDNFGNITSRIGLNGQKNLFHYDQNRRLKYIEGPFGIAAFDYDNPGKITMIVDSWGMKAALKTNSQGQVEETMDNFGIGKCEYNKQGKLRKIIRNGKEKFILNYNTKGQIKNVNSFFGIVRYKYNREICSIIFPGNSKVDLQYNNNMIEKITISDKTQFLNLIPFLEILVFPSLLKRKLR